MDPDLTEKVRRAYNGVSHLYRRDDDRPPEHVAWTAALNQRLPPAGAVLDLGCGCGIPVSRDLHQLGHNVTGVDVSDVQVARARKLVPEARFIRADAAAITFDCASFDAIVCLYALIHMPLDVQPEVIRRCGDWLRPGGWLLATTGHREWTGEEANWLGGDVTMFWSHPDAATYRKWFEAAGLLVVEQQFVTEGNGGHALFWVRKPEPT